MTERTEEWNTGTTDMLLLSSVRNIIVKLGNVDGKDPTKPFILMQVTSEKFGGFSSIG
jgi:hypothetical protein